MARPKIDRRKFVALVPIPIWDKFQEIKERLGVPYDSSTLEHIVIIAHKELIKDYVEIIRNRKPKDKLTPEEKASSYEAEQLARKDVKKKLIYDTGMAICTTLEGDVIDNGNGFYSCKWNTYEKINPHHAMKGSLTVPFEQLDEFHITNQYKNGSKEEILAILAKEN